MRSASTFLIITFLLTFSLAGLGQEAETAPRERCPVCGMFTEMFADWNAEIIFKDSTKAVFDGAKDMFKYYLDLKKYNPTKNKKDITAVTVRDYYSTESIDAAKAGYVIWSDVYGPMGHEPIAFEKEADARQFLKEHKGRKILRFREISLKLLHALDNPP